MTHEESTLLVDRHYLVCFHVGNINLGRDHRDQLNELKSEFCGRVVNESNTDFPSDSIIYFIGDRERFSQEIKLDSNSLYVVRELCTNYSSADKLVSIDQVPIKVHNLGIYFRHFFKDREASSSAQHYFEELKRVHEFQHLTESNKGDVSYRKGIYLTDVHTEQQDAVHFNLLRCSTNFEGPTDAFRSIDINLVKQVNEVAALFFSAPASFNHVLAQIYENSICGDMKQKKARITRHADKTKDMPRNGLIAFCTFYSADIHEKGITRGAEDPYDYRYKDASVLTGLRFKLKENVASHGHIPEFTVKLYPNSVFIIPLSTNRLYTHEIVPPHLPVDKIPTRLGYVMRCSKTKAMHRNGNTYIGKTQGEETAEWVPLVEPTAHDVNDLKTLYVKENVTDEIMNYGEVYFSLNSGDYQKPLL